MAPGDSHDTVQPATAFAAEEGGKVNLLSPNGGLMFWTLLIFIVLLVVALLYVWKKGALEWEK